MKKIEYHKLVRDRIPEIIEKDGKTCVCSELSQEDYIIMLDQKLNEELAEYQESKSMEELADLLEVMSAVAAARAPVAAARPAAAVPSGSAPGAAAPAAHLPGL